MLQSVSWVVRTAVNVVALPKIHARTKQSNACKFYDRDNIALAILDKVYSI